MLKYIFHCFLILIVVSGFSNGGPVDGSAIHKTGDIKLIEYKNIKLEKEKLNIRLEGDYSIVDVEYTLKNKGYTNQKITYGFPIEITLGEMEGMGLWNDEYLPKIEFKVNNAILPIKQQIDISTFESRDSIENRTFELKRSWHIVNFTIDKGEELTLEVHYKVKNGFLDWSTSKNFFESYGKRTLRYDFSPAHNWGNGEVHSMSVNIDTKSILKKGGLVELNGLDFQQENGIYSFSEYNFDLEKAPNLRISYDNKTEKFSQFISKHNVSQKIIKQIKTSSQLEGNYSKENLTDLNYNTAWVEGKSGDGTGETITLSIDDYNLGAICIVNGYTKSESTFNSNNRIKKLKLDLEFLSYDNPNEPKFKSREVNLENKDFVSINGNNFFLLTDIIDQYGEGYYKVRSIKLTILEVYPGTKFNDTCISEIMLLGY